MHAIRLYGGKKIKGRGAPVLDRVSYESSQHVRQRFERLRLVGSFGGQRDLRALFAFTLLSPCATDIWLLNELAF